MDQQLPIYDSAYSALLNDLDDRGMLETTLVITAGEFGRTPKVQWESPWNGGRGHHGACFSSVVAGGGFRGGQVVGASDARGEEVSERPVSPRDLLASIYDLMGIDPSSPLKNPRGLDVAVLPPNNSSAGDGPLTEIM